jgi:hypothetical protein
MVRVTDESSTMRARHGSLVPSARLTSLDAAFASGDAGQTKSTPCTGCAETPARMAVGRCGINTLIERTSALSLSGSLPSRMQKSIFSPANAALAAIASWAEKSIGTRASVAASRQISRSERPRSSTASSVRSRATSGTMRRWRTSSQLKTERTAAKTYRSRERRRLMCSVVWRKRHKLSLARREVRATYEGGVD